MPNVPVVGTKHGGQGRDKKMANGSARNFMKRRHDRKRERCEAVAERTAQWKACTPEEQVVLLDSRLGKGLGAVKQRARLAAKMASRLEASKPKEEKPKKKKGPDPTKKKGV